MSKMTRDDAYILFWDDDIKEHCYFNSLTTSRLSEFLNLSIINYPWYLRSLKQIPLISRGKKGLRGRLYNFANTTKSKLKYINAIRLIQGKSKIYVNSGSPRWQYHLNSSLKKRTIVFICIKSALQYLLIKVRGIAHVSGYRLSLVDIKNHLTVDLSLQAKMSADVLSSADKKVYKMYLNSLIWHTLNSLNRMSTITSANNNIPLIISTSVYSLDWICRDYALKKGYMHRFATSTPFNREHSNLLKIHKSYAEDLHTRRSCQENLSVNSRILDEAVEYGLFYINSRFHSLTSHTYSPLDSSFAELLPYLKKCNNVDKKLWVYFSNSPDELKSIDHSIRESGTTNLYCTRESGAAQSEEEAIKLLARLAVKCNAELVVRLHPRLGRDQRVKKESSALQGLLNACREAHGPEHGPVNIVMPEDKINSYILGILADKVICFRGTMPLELSLLGIKPIVLAKEKGFSNFWIKIHSDSAPKSSLELQRQLEDPVNLYKPSELATFLIEFWTIFKLGEISLNDNTTQKLVSAIYSDEYIASEFSVFQSPSLATVDPAKLSRICDKYAAKARKLVANWF